MDERLRSEGPVSNLVHDLIQVLSEKVDGAARYGIYIDDARADGCETCAAIFRECDEHDRKDVAHLLEHLASHLSRMSAGSDAWSDEEDIGSEGESESTGRASSISEEAA